MIGLQLFRDATWTEMIADWTARVQRVRFSSGPHGFEQMSFVVPMTMDEAFEVYDWHGALHVVLGALPVVAWEGRVEDVALTGQGLNVTALGYWRAMYDLPYTYLWSDTQLQRWRVTPDDLLAAATPANFAMDKNQRLFIAPRKAADYATSGPDRGEWYYKEPDQQRGSIKEVTFDYEMESLSSDWTAELRSFDFGYASLNTEWSLAGDGTTQTGSVTATLSTARDYVAFSLKPTSTVTGFAPETGEQYIKITNVRVKGTDSTNVYADEIMNDLVAFVNGVNSNQVSSETGLIESPAVDLFDEVFEDMMPGDVATYLAGLGSSDTPPVLYETGIFENRRVYFRPRNEQKVWYVDLVDPDIARSLSSVHNSAYAIYQDTDGTNLRTGNDSNDFNVALFGIARRKAVTARTTDATQAETLRDVTVADEKDARPMAKLATPYLMNEAGSLHYVWEARSGDTIVVRNLPVAGSDALDRLRRFRLERVEIELSDDGAVATLIPEMDMPQFVTQA